MPPANPLKRVLIGQVRALFNDPANTATPVVRQPDGLFGPNSVAWRVHGDITSMLVGGVASLMLQMLHPKVLAGVWDHSGFRADMHGRLRRTARFIAVTTYAGRAEADAAIARVNRIHAQVTGTLPDGTEYAANDPRLLAWVHVTEATSFLDAWIRYGEPGMSRADQDRYFEEMAVMATALGADPVPAPAPPPDALIESMRPELVADDRTREVAHLVLDQRAASLAAEPFQQMTMLAALDLLPAWARTMHGRPAAPPLARPLLRVGTFGLAQTLRWAFR